MKTIYQARELIHKIVGRKVEIKVMGLRNKIDVYEGIISEYYNNIFILNTEMGKKSFTYTDVLIGNIKVILKDT